jgi:hypothetical protein
MEMNKIQLNKETEQNIEKFYRSTLTENEFIRLLLPYMCKKGINKITEEELSKKLFPYYLDERYKALFVDIAKVRYGNQVDIANGMYSEKFFSGNIMWISNNPDLLHLIYEHDYDTSECEKDINPEIIKLLTSVADELAIRDKVETSKLNIYGYDPNTNYTILEAKYYGVYGLELITDGNIQTIFDYTFEPHIFYPDPSGNSEARIYKEGIFKDITIENASYAIMQGTYDRQIKKIEIFTKLLELEKLKKISEIANEIHTDEESLLVSGRPYVRKLTL